MNHKLYKTNQDKQGKRQYIHKLIGVLYPDPDAYESKTLFQIQYKTRDKYSDEMIPLTQTMIDSFKFTEIKKWIFLF